MRDLCEGALCKSVRPTASDTPLLMMRFLTLYDPSCKFDIRAIAGSSVIWRGMEVRCQCRVRPAAAKIPNLCQAVCNGSTYTSISGSISMMPLACPAGICVSQPFRKSVDCQGQNAKPGSKPRSFQALDSQFLGVGQVWDVALLFAGSKRLPRKG